LKLLKIDLNTRPSFWWLCDMVIPDLDISARPPSLHYVVMRIRLHPNDIKRYQQRQRRQITSGLL